MSAAAGGRRAAHCADRMHAQKTGERTGSRPKPPEAGAQRASLEPGRAPGYSDHHSCSPASRVRMAPGSGVAGVGREHRLVDAEHRQRLAVFAIKIGVEDEFGVGGAGQPAVGEDFALKLA
jgi:hypothetical protein